MAFTIYLHNSKQRVYSMEAAINLASMLLAAGYQSREH